MAPPPGDKELPDEGKTLRKRHSWYAAPPHKAAPPPHGDADSAANAEQMDLNLLHELRVEIQDLQELMGRVSSGETTLEAYADYIKKTVKDVTQIMERVKDGDYADTFRQLRNSWELIRVCPLIIRPTAEFKPLEQLQHLSMLDAQCKKIVFNIAYLTIPDRVNSWLKLSRPGYYLPFHDVFKDELPGYDERVAILGYLAVSPDVIPSGIVDVENGLIYRYSENPKHRLISLIVVIGAFAAAIGVVIGATYLPVDNWPLKAKDLSTVVIGWIAVVLGVAVHLAIGTLKRKQSQKGQPPILAVSDILLQIDARLGQILLKLLFTLIGFFGLIFTAGVDKATPFNFFLVGYTLDSVVELFGSSIEQRAAAQTETIKKQLGLSGK